MKNTILLLLFLLPYFNYAQKANTDIDYTLIDNHSKTIKYKGDIFELVSALTKNCTDDFQKSRAIYFWITENISYDYKTFNKKRKAKTFKCKSKEECALKAIKWENKFTDKVLRKKKAICSG